MFKRPEELIMAVLALVWAAFCYFAAAYLGAPGQTALLIGALNLLAALVLFVLWLRNLHRWVWPLFLGAFAACWWPFLDWLAVGGMSVDGTIAEALSTESVADMPWYAAWPFKSALAALPALAGYAVKFKRWRKRRTEAV
ncbi:MAG: hypothetical protein Q4D82_00875 [Neisseria sp.]|nr:hypothetical protein [Neisseria sp.]